MGLKLFKMQYINIYLMFVIFCMTAISECHNLKQAMSSPNKQPGQLFKWYLKRLAITNRKPQNGVANSINIQADEPGCRDDLCIEDDLDYFYDKIPVEVSTLDAKGVACPQGYVPVVSDGVIYCDVWRKTSTSNILMKQCRENEERVGTECRPVTKITHIAERDSQENDDTGCKVGQVAVPREHGTECIDKQKRNTSTPAVDIEIGSTTKDLITEQGMTMQDDQFDESSTLVTDAGSFDKSSTLVTDAGYFNKSSTLVTDARSFYKLSTLVTDAGSFDKSSTLVTDAGSFDKSSTLVTDAGSFNKSSTLVTVARSFYKSSTLVTDAGSFDKSSTLVTDAGSLSTMLDRQTVGSSLLTTDSRTYGITADLLTKLNSLNPSNVASTDYKTYKTLQPSPIITSLSSILTCPDGQELIHTEAGSLCQRFLKQTTVIRPGNKRCSDDGKNCPNIQTSDRKQTTKDTLKEHLNSYTATVGLTTQIRINSDPIQLENVTKYSKRPQVFFTPYHSVSFPIFGSGNTNRINSNKEGHTGKKKFDRSMIDSKLTPCKDGKVLAGTREGYKCVDPTFPGEVCPSGRVPHLSSTGLQCVSCPFGQHTQMVDGGIKCVVMPSVSPTTDPSVTPCPDGMIPYQSSVGRICKHAPVTTQSVEKLCPDGQISIIDGTKIKCKNTENFCPPGRVPITIETGEIICGFDIDEQIEDSSEEKLSNICPPGLEAVHLTSGEISCQYLTESTTVPSSRSVSWCGIQEILTHTSQGFQCQTLGNIPEKLPLPDCTNDLILVQFGQYYDCITENEAKLQCKGNEELMREDAGFLCKTVWDDSVQSLCGSDEVVNTDVNGHISCITMLEAEEQCGVGFMAVKYRNGFICKERSLQVKCPDGYEVQLVRGTPTCVSISGSDCIDIDGSISELCGTELPDLDPDFMFESGNNCKEGQMTTLIDGTQICIDEVDVRFTDQLPCELDGVRPCDLDLDLLLQGCNPECANGGTCKDGKCLCSEGITGVACSQDIDECTSLPDTDCGYKCENTFGSFHCSCPHGLILGTNGRTCEGPGCIPDCLNGGQCVRGTCQCQQGFEGEYCQTDKDECSLYGDRLCQHYCRNTHGGYECICPPGSRLSQDKRTCTNTTCIPECRNGGSCEAHRCNCPPGFYGFVCQFDLNECYRDSLCSHNCVNTLGSYICMCREGYRLGLDGHSCL